MNLDDLNYFKGLDSNNLLAAIDGLPGQIEAAWALGQQLPMPDLSGVTSIVLCGSGSAALGGALVAAYGLKACRAPLVINGHDDLPAWAAGPGTLVVGVAYAGGAEETLSAFSQAVERKTRLLAIATGGSLAALSREAGGAVWQFDSPDQPRAAMGYMLALPLALLGRAGFLPDASAELAGAVAALRDQQKRLRADSPVARNPAKRMAGQFMDRYVLLFGAGAMGVVARWWQAQIAANARAWSQAETLPEMTHTGLAGPANPEALITKYMAVFLESDFDHPRDQVRSRQARELLMTAGFNTDFVRGAGASPLAQLLTSLHYGDYVSYYLAMAYGIDPTRPG